MTTRQSRSHYSRLLKKVWVGILPRRASTQAWMMLTFALFVGVSVLVVGLLVLNVLRSEVQNATRSILYQHAARTASLMERAETNAERQQIIDTLNRTTILRYVASIGGITFGGTSSDLATYLNQDYAWSDHNGSDLLSHLDRRAARDGTAVLSMALFRPEAGLIIRVEQTAPPHINLTENVTSSLIIGLSLILFFSLLGSWIAARQVVKPLHAIRNSARSIAEGQFDERIRVESRAAEFQDLAKRLNQMSSGLREKIEELQRLTQLQSEFIGNVSHEVKNPIFAVGGYLEALSTSNLKEEQRRRYAEKGLANLQRLNNLFNDLIEIARLEYREDILSPRVFDLQELLDEVADTLRPKAHEKGLQLEAENPAAEVLADRNRIRQVLVNLIDNAIAYTDEGNVRCRFRRRLDKVRVEVIDTGKGIPEDHLERIFERFYRVDPDRSRKSGGTGLGLSIVKQILHAHGETIHVESTVGRGTRFWFELPFASQSVEVEEAV